MHLRRDPSCPACGTRTIRELTDYDVFCGDAPLSADDSISVQSLAAMIDRGDDVDLIDVREPSEWAVDRIEGATLMPLGTVDSQLHSLDRSRRIVLYCKSGQRSANAARVLRGAGFANVASLTGGLMAWRRERASDG